MPEDKCLHCDGSGWIRKLVDDDHGTWWQQVRCVWCNPQKWSSVLDLVLARNEFWQERHDDKAIEQVDAILDELVVDLDQQTEDKLKKLLT